MWWTRCSTRALGGFALVVSLLLVGCNAEKRTTTTKATEEPAAAPAETQQTAATPIPVTVVDKAGFEKAVAAHRGRVVLVDYWATWCGPCVKQFPHTVESWQKYRDRGLDVIALSFDDPSDLAPVQAFLAEKGATFENLISKVGADASSADEFDYDGALPHYALYDREGKLAKQLSPSDPTINFRLELIDAAIEELLAVPAAK